MPKSFTVKIPSVWPKPTSADVQRWLQDFFTRGSVNSIGPDPGAGDYVLRLSLPERAVSKLSESLGDAPAPALRRLVAHYQQALPGHPSPALPSARQMYKGRPVAVEATSPPRPVRVVPSQSVVYAEAKPRGWFNSITGLWHGTGSLFGFDDHIASGELQASRLITALDISQQWGTVVAPLENPRSVGFQMPNNSAQPGFFARHPEFAFALIVAGVVLVVWAYRKLAAPAKVAAEAATVPAMTFQAWTPLP